VAADTSDSPPPLGPWRPDTAGNRDARKYTTAEQVRRVLWMPGELLLRLSPRTAFAWRRGVLRAFGARIGRHVNIYSTVRIAQPWNLTIGDWSAVGDSVLIYNLGPVTLGCGVTLSYRAHLCAGSHDLRDPRMPLLRPPIHIEDHAWVGTEAFIGPGVRVGEASVLGARAVVVRDVAAGAIVAGNPARVIGTREGYAVASAGSKG
jgi:putative colanic acid biosynthesis acetyltransferase WcaF